MKARFRFGLPASLCVALGVYLHKSAISVMVRCKNRTRIGYDDSEEEKNVATSRRKGKKRVRAAVEGLLTTPRKDTDDGGGDSQQV